MNARLDVGRVGAWWDSAACKGRGDLFYATDQFSQRLAVAVCRSCAVRAECLADAMATEPPGPRFGVIGGLTAEQRNWR